MSIQSAGEQAMTDAEQIAVTKLWYVAKHLNISDPPQPTDLLTAVALVEHAAEWARMHIERRGKENDELREQAIKLAAGQFAAHDQSLLLAEAVRQARLDEAKWWDKNSNAEDEAQATAQASRIAYLERQQEEGRK